MKKETIIGLLAAFIIAGAGTCFITKEANRKETFLEWNLEALSQNETPSIQLECSTTSPIIYCSAFCFSCRLLWQVPGISGQYIDGSSTCTCGATL